MLRNKKNTRLSYVDPTPDIWTAIGAMLAFGFVALINVAIWGGLLVLAAFLIRWVIQTT